MPDFDVELGVGDSLRIGSHILTVIDIQRGEISVRIDPFEDGDDFISEIPNPGNPATGRLRPR
jgi:hypothetical protein